MRNSLFQTTIKIHMRKLGIFNFITLNGYFKAPNGDTSWHKHGGEEETIYAADMLQLNHTLLFGRLTYEMMAGYWPTPFAMENDPLMAEGMNRSDKIVFSTTLKTATWNNTRLIRENMIEEIKKLKQLSGKDMTLLGSGSILTQLAANDLIDEYKFMVDPLALGDGTPLFKGLSHILELTLTGSRIFKSGVVLLCYQPIRD
jgi:dihydrofolate reductase